MRYSQAYMNALRTYINVRQEYWNARKAWIDAFHKFQEAWEECSYPGGYPGEHVDPDIYEARELEVVAEILNSLGKEKK